MFIRKSVTFLAAAALLCVGALIGTGGARAVLAALGPAAASEPAALKPWPVAYVVATEARPAPLIQANTAIAPMVAPPRLDASVVMGASRFDAASPVALASGSSFHLELQVNQGGYARVFAISPDGHLTPLWAGPIHAGHVASTDTLRLEGRRGLETIRVEFTPAGSAGWPRPPAAVRQVRILHV